MQGNSKVRLDFFGHSYFLSPKGEEEVDLRDLVAYIEEVVNDVTHANPNLPAHKQIVLTVLSITKDYFLTRAEYKGLKSRLERLLNNLTIRCK